MSPAFVTRVVDHEMDTALVAEQFDGSRRHIQQLAKEYRETGEIPTLEHGVGRPMGSTRPISSDASSSAPRNTTKGAEAIVHMLRSQPDITIANYRVHEIHTEHVA